MCFQQQKVITPRNVTKTYMPVCHTGVTTFHTWKVRQISMYKHVVRPQGFASDEIQEKMFGFEGDNLKFIFPMHQDTSFDLCPSKLAILASHMPNPSSIQVISLRLQGNLVGENVTVLRGPSTGIHIWQVRGYMYKQTERQNVGLRK